ncbi:hypothetical protein [Neopusillimonas maritima]|uniref:Uncharacterized protein n=1 Tax=Neopusillimonas maritima TaxID=2026239 RepID=A0ABX9N0S0_9BURK|nr:hypothetical protein [Neopusillimonas maritima]RII84356.1 hypothetical protein CJO09_03855 [Neopusillimonas maritima]
MLEQTLFEVEDFPIGSRVKLPSGRSGVVIAHKGYESKRDPFMRVMIKLDGGDRQDVVQLQPKMLRHFDDSKDRIQTWCGDQLATGDVVRLPSGRLATVLVISHTVRRGNSVGAVTARIHDEQDSDALVELAAHLVRRVAPTEQAAKQFGPELLSNVKAAEPTGHPVNVSNLGIATKTDLEETRGQLGGPQICKLDSCRLMLEAIEHLGYSPKVFPAWNRSEPVREHKELIAQSLGWTPARFISVWRYLQAQGLIIESDVVACQATLEKGTAPDLATPDAAILQTIAAMGFNPKAFPCAKPARKAKSRRSVQSLSGLTRRQFDRVWRQLCRAGQIVEKDPRGSCFETVEND